MGKSNSLTGVITPVKTPALKRIGQSISVTVHKHTRAPVAIQITLMCRCSTTLPPTFSLFFSQRSISFRTEARPLPPAALRPRSKASSFPRRRNSQCWSDTVESHDLTVKEIKRQEVRWTTNLESFSCTEKNFSNKMQCVLGISGSGCGAVGLWFAVCAGWLVLCAISLKPFYTAIMKEDVSWHCRLNFPSWTISCKKNPKKNCQYVYFTSNCTRVCIHVWCF